MNTWKQLPSKWQHDTVSYLRNLRVAKEVVCCPQSVGEEIQALFSVTVNLRSESERENYNNERENYNSERENYSRKKNCGQKGDAQRIKRLMM